MAPRNYGLCLIAATLALGNVATGQVGVSLPEASARQAPDLIPARLGQSLRVSGVVAFGPVPLPGTYHVVIQDESGAGLTLEGQLQQFAAFEPGTRVDVRGTLAELAGMPVLWPSAVRKVGKQPAPAPQNLTIAELNDVRNLGRYVKSEGTVQWSGQNAGGDILAIGSEGKKVTVFFAFSGRRRDPVFANFSAGDRVGVTGLSAQYCPHTPHDRGFQIVVSDSLRVILLDKRKTVSPALLGWTLSSISFLLCLWWWREDRLSRQRQTLRRIMALAEDVIGAGTPSDSAQKLEGASEDLLPGGKAQMFLHSEKTESLDRVLTALIRTPLSIPVNSSGKSLHSLIPASLRDRALFAIPDLRGTLLVEGDETGLPRCAVVVPMIAQENVLGVIALFSDRASPTFTTDFLAAMTHLANQVAASMKLGERQRMKEQLLRSAKMAAAGQLIAGVAQDLKVPLENIQRSCQQSLKSNIGLLAAEYRHISSEAARCLSLIGHVLSFSQMEQREPRPLDCCALVGRLLARRDEERDRRGLTLEVQIPQAALEVLADWDQLEQAFLTAIAQAEHSAFLAPDRTLRVEVRHVGARVQVEFQSMASETPALSHEGAADYFGFPVAQAICQSHRGDLRTESVDGRLSLVVELPLCVPASTTDGGVRRAEPPARTLTALIVEPDLISQRRLLAMLAARGHRAIPCANSEEAADLAGRMNFDLLFCASATSGLSCLDLYHRVRRRVGVFALITDSHDDTTSPVFKGGDGHVIAKPVGERDLDHLIGIAEVRWAVSRG